MGAKLQWHYRFYQFGRYFLGFFFKTKLASGLGRKLWTSCSPMKVEIGILSVENEAVTVTNAGLKTPQVIQQLSCILFPHTLYFWSQNAKPSTDETVPMKTERNIWHFWDWLGSDALSTPRFFGFYQKIRQRWKDVCWQQRPQQLFSVQQFIYITKSVTLVLSVFCRRRYHGEINIEDQFYVYVFVDGKINIEDLRQPPKGAGRAC